MGCAKDGGDRFVAQGGRSEKILSAVDAAGLGVNIGWFAESTGDLEDDLLTVGIFV